MMKSTVLSSKRLAAALTLCIFSFGAQAASDAERQGELLPVYIAASDGDSDARERAYEGYSQWVKEDPTNPVAQVYYGGTLALKGRDAWMPWNKIRHTEKGLDMMAKAVELIEDSPTAHDKAFLAKRADVLSMAGITFTQVPKMLGRFDEGFDLLIGLIESDQLSALPIEMVEHIYYYAGQAAEVQESDAQAVGFYNTMVERGATGPISVLAKQRLAELSAGQ